MVDDSVRGFWTQVADGLRDRISSQDWCSWFAGAEAVELGAERIVVEVVNDFAARWVDQRFRGVLEQTVAEIAGVPLQVVIVARAGAAAPLEAAASEPPSVIDTVAAAAAEQIQRAGTGRGGVGGNVMSEAELLAELASGDVLPNQTLGPAADSEGAFAPAAATAGAAAGAPLVVREGDDEVAGVQRLNERYRFETFVIGPGNQMVHAAALSVAETPSQSYNPLFIHGGTGLGKTHLLHAIGHYVRDTRPGARVAYVTTEQFLSRFIQAIQAGKAPGAGSRDGLKDRLKAYFRGVDVLLMDDVQFLAGKGTWLQEEIFHIFNALHENGRQIVLTSDSKPERIPQLEERLRSRFAWGLIADIDTPDRETRIAILRKKAQVDQLEVPQEVFEEIAERITTNVRELEGALTRVVAAASLSGRAVTIDLAATVLDAYSPGQGEPVTIERIQNVVCEHFTIERDDLLSGRRTAALTLPRQIAMYLSRVLIGAPSMQVAHRFNRKDHTTVLHAEKKIDGMIRSDQEVHDLVAQLTVAVRGSAGRIGITR